MSSADKNKAWLYCLFIDLAGVAILLQGLWAGIFLQRDGRREDEASWIDVHARGGEVAIVLALVAAVVAWIWLRSSKRICVGTSLLTVGLVLESYLGGEIRVSGKFSLTVIHVPLAMVLVALVVWLSTKVHTGQMGRIERKA